MGYVDRNGFAMIADHGACGGSLDHPFGDEAFGKFTLCIFVIEKQPTMAHVERPQHAVQFHLAEAARAFLRKTLVEPQPGTHFHGAALALFI